jgi:hypothetical protein
LENNQYAFQKSVASPLVCHCALESGNAASPEDAPSVGRREALVSIVAILSAASTSREFRQVSNNRGQGGVLELEDAVSSVLNDEVAFSTGKPTTPWHI